MDIVNEISSVLGLINIIQTKDIIVIISVIIIAVTIIRIIIYQEINKINKELLKLEEKLNIYKRLAKIEEKIGLKNGS